MKMKKEVIVLIFLISIMQVNAAGQEGTITVGILSDECRLDFKQGWNLFSLCSNLNDPDLTKVLSPINGKYRYIMEWDKVDQSFEIYSPRALAKPFTNLNDNLSYFIYMYEPASLKVLGPDPGTETRNLIIGWDTPAYQYRISTTITVMIRDVINNFRYLMKWDATNQEFNIYSKRSVNNPFNDIFPGEGRFIYMENQDTITR